MGYSMKIGEVARRAGLTAEAIRYYEREGLLPKPIRTHTGYRLYEPEILATLSFIKQARRLGLSLREIKQILRTTQSGQAPCGKVREVLAAKLKELDATIAELLQFRDRLRQFLGKINELPDQADTSQNICCLIQMAPQDLIQPRAVHHSRNP